MPFNNVYIMGLILPKHVKAKLLRYSKPCLKRPPKMKTKLNWLSRPTVTKCRLKVLQNAPNGHSVKLSTLNKLALAIRTFVLSIFEWPLKPGFTVCLLRLR